MAETKQKVTVEYDVKTDKTKKKVSGLKAAFQKFIWQGKGFVAIHSGTVTETEWPWYGELIGAYFTGHPPVQKGKLIIENKKHPATDFFKDS